MDYAPVVTANPSSQTVNAGKTATFTATASGSPTPTVQWEVSASGATAFSAISGATSTTYSFTTASTDNGSQYEAVFSNGIGTVATTTPATLTVDYVTKQPGSQTVNAGAVATFTAGSNSSGDTVQWEVSRSGATAFTVVTGATSTTYSFATTSAANGNQYEAVFSNSSGNFSSNPATLTVDYVTMQPGSQTVEAGATVTFTASSNSSADMVQWDMSTAGATAFTPVTGATSATYSFAASSADNDNQYEAVFSNSSGNFASNPAKLTVDYAPTVTSNPVSESANAGKTATFTAAANANPAATVQWEVSASGAAAFSTISGATSTTYSFTAGSADNGSQYEAVFSNGIGTAATSTPATLTVDYVTTSPTNQTVNAGATVTFVAASSNPSGADTVQWDVSTSGATAFTPISGATSTTYSFTAGSADNGNQYEAVFSNSAGTLTSTPATLAVDYAPVVTANPTSLIANAGKTVTFTAAASANPSATVQWEVSTSGATAFSAIGGATSTTYSFTASSAENDNQYEAVFSNSIGTATSTPSTLTVDYITASPSDQIVVAGLTASFTSASSNPGGADKVQWEVSTSGATAFSAISAATSTTYSFTTSSAENGSQYEAVFSNSAGTLTSGPATLTVDYAPTITATPAKQTVDVGQTAAFTASASANPTATVQWEVSTSGATAFTPISGATSITYGFTTSSTDNGSQYEAVFSNSIGTTTTAPATLTVDYVTTQPGSQIVNTGQDASFTAASSNLSGDTVQWEVSSSGATAFTPISGATSSTYSFTAGSAANGNQYEAVFSNGGGTLTSNIAILEVDYVTTSPTSQGINEGDVVTFTVSSSNPGGSDTVQWEVSSSGATAFTPVSGAISTSYSFTTTSAENGNQYDAIFSNGDGSFTSSLATLSVGFSPSVTASPTTQTVYAGKSVTLTAAATGNPAPVVQWEVSTSGATAFTSISGATSTTYTFTASGADAGNQYEAVFSNGIGAAVTTSAATLTVVYVAADQTDLGPNNDTAAGFTINGGTVGETFSYVAKSSGGSGTVTGSGTLSSTSQDVTNINVSGLTAGTLTYTVTLSGSPSTPLTATAPLKIIPSGYTIEADQSSYNLVTPAGFTITVPSNDIGDTILYIVNGNENGFVSSTATIASSPQDITGIDTSTFKGTEVQFEVWLTDPAGNQGDEVTTSVPLYATAPDPFTISPSPTTINASTAADTSFSFAGATTGTTYSYTITSSGGAGSVTGSGPVNASGQSVSNIDVSSLPVGTLTYSVTLTNSYGNPTTETTTADLASSLNGFTVTPDLSELNSVAASSAGFTLAGVEIGSKFTYTISGNGGSPVVPGGATVSGSGSVTSNTQDVTGIDLSTLGDGTITFSVTLTDVAGATSNAVNATATIDREQPAEIALSTSAALSGQPAGTLVGLLETNGPLSTTGYTYTLVSGAGGGDNGSFQISGDELLTNAVLGAAGTTYDIRVRSTDALGNFIEQQFVITSSANDPITPSLSLSNNDVAAGAANALVGTLSTSPPDGGVLGATIDYTLVPGTGSNDNSSFQIVNGQLETATALQAGTYTVRVRISSTFLLNDAVDLGGITGPYTLQMTFGTGPLPAGSFGQLAANAGLITLSSDPTPHVWNPAASSTNKEVPGSLTQPNYQGDYDDFWTAVTTADSTATLSNVVGSSGIDLSENKAWAVIDQPGEYAVAVQVFNEQVFTIQVI